MRKTLVASAAMIGGMLAWAAPATAQQQPPNPATPPPAQTPVPNYGQPFGPATATPGVAYWLTPPLSTATPTQTSFVPTAGSTPAPGSGPPDGPNTTAIPAFWNNPPLAAGNLTVRLQGKLTVDIGAVADSGQHPSQVTLNSGSGAGSHEHETGKLCHHRLRSSLSKPGCRGRERPQIRRLSEIRADNGAAPGGGANGSVSAANISRGQLYLYRETGYLGTPGFGYIRFGETDGVLSLFTTGTNEAFNSGGWNGDKVGFTTNTIPVWPFANYPNEINTGKVVYVSPRYADTFDFGVSFEPDTGGGGPTIGNCPYANTVAGTGTAAIGCDTTSSTSVAAETGRRRNTIEAVARGIGSIGPVGLAGTLGGATSGSVAYDGTSTVTHYDGLGFLDSGIQINYGGFQVGAHILTGHINGAWSLDPKGGRDAVDWNAGASYAVGPLTVGVQYVNFESAGAWTPYAINTGRTRSESGVGAGGTLTIAPSTFLVLNYLYGQRHQSGVDLLTGVTNARTNNNTLAQGLSLSASIRW